MSGKRRTSFDPADIAAIRTALVSTNPLEGDYTSILTACATEPVGARIEIRDGIYSETGDITVKSKQILRGESRDGTIINFGGADRSIGVTGDTPYSTGTVTVTRNSKTITGSGTLWLANLEANDYIVIDGVAMQIASIGADITLTLVNYYEGVTRAGIYYYAGTFKEGMELRNLTVRNANISGSFRGMISFKAVVGLVIDNVCARDSNVSFNYGINAEYCPNSKINDCLVYNNGTGIVLGSCDGSTVSKCITYQHYYGAGISVSNGNNIKVTNCLSHGNRRGITVQNNFIRRFAVIGNTCVGNYEDGIVVASINDSMGTVTGNVCSYNGTNGIQINNADDIIISGNSICYNIQHGIYILGGSHQTCITGNIIIDNDSANTTTYDGIYIDSGTLYTVVVGNRLNNNDRYQINNAGTGTIIEGNNTYSNDKVGEVNNTGTMDGKNYNFTNAAYEYFGVDGSGYVLTTNVSSPVTCKAEICYDNIGAVGAVTYNLPTAVRGARIKFIVSVAQNMVITAAAGDYIRIGSNSSSVAGTCTSNTQYSVIELECIDADSWIAQLTPVGTWTLA